jgi:hypothetical protein
MNLTRMSTFIETNKTLKQEKEGFGPKWPSSTQLREQANPYREVRPTHAACPGVAWWFFKKDPALNTN